MACFFYFKENDTMTIAWLNKKVGKTHSEKEVKVNQKTWELEDTTILAEIDSTQFIQMEDELFAQNAEGTLVSLADDMVMPQLVQNTLPTEAGSPYTEGSMLAARGSSATGTTTGISTLTWVAGGILGAVGLGLALGGGGGGGSSSTPGTSSSSRPAATPGMTLKDVPSFEGEASADAYVLGGNIGTIHFGKDSGQEKSISVRVGNLPSVLLNQDKSNEALFVDEAQTFFLNSQTGEFISRQHMVPEATIAVTVTDSNGDSVERTITLRPLESSQATIMVRKQDSGDIILRAQLDQNVQLGKEEKIVLKGSLNGNQGAFLEMTDGILTVSQQNPMRFEGQLAVKKMLADSEEARVVRELGHDSVHVFVASAENAISGDNDAQKSVYESHEGNDLWFFSAQDEEGIAGIYADGIPIELQTAGGNDTVMIRTGNGNHIEGIWANNQGTILVDLGEGKDLVDIRVQGSQSDGVYADGLVRIVTGAGQDGIVIESQQGDGIAIVAPDSSESNLNSVRIETGDDNDLVHISSIQAKDGFVLLDGGAGSEDTLVLAKQPADTTYTLWGSGESKGTVRILNFEHIFLNKAVGAVENGDITLKIEAPSSSDAVQAPIYIDGDSQDSVVLAGGWTTGNTHKEGYAYYTYKEYASVYIQQGVQVAWESTDIIA